MIGRASLLAALAFAGLAGCNDSISAPGEPEPSDNSSSERAVSPAVPPPPLPAPETIVGEYRVAGIDGTALNVDFGIAVSITPDTISYEPSCLGFEWTYDWDGTDLRTQRLQRGDPPAPGEPPPPVCAVRVDQEYRALGEAIDAARSVGRTPENGLKFSGGDRSAVLFSQ
jgi:hypothetical protein